MTLRADKMKNKHGLPDISLPLKGSCEVDIARQSVNGHKVPYDPLSAAGLSGIEMYFYTWLACYFCKDMPRQTDTLDYSHTSRNKA